MTHYEQLLKMGCFTWEELCALTGNRNTANSLAKSYLQKGYLRSVRRGLYVTVNLADDEPAAGPYRIAGKITSTAYVSHHAAFAYYGCANQVSNRVEVSSETPFAPFEFNGTEYVYLASRLAQGVVVQPDGARVTDIERTILDNIGDFEKIMGLEELLRCLELIPAVNENKLLEYLAAYGKQVLYQKSGYILEHYRAAWGLSDAFFAQCAARIGKSKRYLFTPTGAEDVEYNRAWRLVVPKNLFNATAEGVDDAEV